MVLVVSLGLISAAMAEIHDSCDAATLTITAIGELPEYDVTISSTLGGSVDATFDEEETVIGPGETETISDVLAGTVVALVARPHEGHRFVNWTGDVDTIADLNAAETTITVNGDYSILASFEELPPQPANWALIGGITAAVVVVGLVIFFVRRKRAAEGERL